MVKSFYKWLENETKSQNQWIREEEEIRYFFCEDTIWDDFVCDADVSEEDSEGDDYEVLKPLWDEWAKTSKPFDYTQDDIDERRRENAADLRTQAMEMGYHNYSSANGGTWYMD